MRCSSRFTKSQKTRENRGGIAWATGVAHADEALRLASSQNARAVESRGGTWPWPGLLALLTCKSLKIKVSCYALANCRVCERKYPDWLAGSITGQANKSGGPWAVGKSRGYKFCVTSSGYSSSLDLSFLNCLRLTPCYLSLNHFQEMKGVWRLFLFKWALLKAVFNSCALMI